MCVHGGERRRCGVKGRVISWGAVSVRAWLQLTSMWGDGTWGEYCMCRTCDVRGNMPWGMRVCADEEAAQGQRWGKCGGGDRAITDAP